jgi:protein disulfide-isomerase A1
VLGKVDATVHRGHGVEIKGYPTLKIFRNGKMSDYNGPRKADGIVSYMKKQMGPAARTVSTQAELDALLMQDPAVQYAIVAFFPSEGKASQLSSSFSILANRMRDEFAFGRSTDAALAASQGVPAGGEALVAYLRGEKTVYTGSSKTGDVEAWIRENSLPLVGEFNDATAPIYHARNLPIAKLFINVDKSPKGASSKTMTYYTNRLKKIANQFSGRILVAYADKQEQKNAFEALNFEPEDVNTFAIEEPREGKWYKYEEEEDEEEEEALQKSKDGKKKKAGLDVEGWSHLVEDYLAGDATAYVKSQKAPKDNLTRPVKIATGNNFDDLINQDDKDVLIEFYGQLHGSSK